MNKKILIIIIICITSSFTEYVLAVDLKPVVPAPGYQHDRFNTQPKDIVRHFRAYTTSFDGGDDNNKNGSSDKLAIPEWVSYELRKSPEGLGKGPKRPSS
jgi:hypothetical protein